MSTLQLRIYDGTRQLFSAPANFLVTITDGNQTRIIDNFYNSPTLVFNDLPFYDNLFDNYTVNVWAKGYQTAGFVPVKLSDAAPVTLDIMLIATAPGFNFSQAQWPQVSPLFPFLGGDVAPAAAQTRYENLTDQQPLVVACFLNLVEAMTRISLPSGTPLDYIKQIRWDMPPAQDRFFAYCDAALVDQVRTAAANGQFAVEPNPGLFHPGATNSWKQIEFGEANVQLTFHENAPDTTTIDGVHCVTVEPDIDYYRDLLAHAILEVAENALTHSLTDPTQVYVLRWIAGQQAGVPQFAPLYTLTDDQPAAIATQQTPATTTTPQLKTRP